MKDEPHLKKSQAYKFQFPDVDDGYGIKLDNGIWVGTTDGDDLWMLPEKTIEKRIDNDEIEVTVVPKEETPFKRKGLQRTNPTQCPACEAVGKDWNQNNGSFRCPDASCGVDRFYRGLLEGEQPHVSNYRRGEDGRGI